MAATPAVNWNTYGGNAAHTRTYTGHQFDGGTTATYSRPTPGLMEFPPTYHGGTAFVATDGGTLMAFRVSDGKTLWNVKVGGVAADSPTWAKGRVVVQTRGAGATGLAAFRATDGHLAWRHTGFQGESTPTPYGNWVCGASSAGAVSCFGLDSGAVKWTYQDGCKVTGSLARAGTYLYLADYCGHTRRLGVYHGAVKWTAATPGVTYGNTAVDAGRVIVPGRDCGCLYALSASTGARLWRSARLTGNGYPSPAVTSTRVYWASRGGSIAAFNVATGGIVWRHETGAAIMGSPVVVGSVTYYSTMGANFTRGNILGYSQNGAQTVTWLTDGRYSPVVVMGDVLCYVGQVRLYMRVPS